MKVGIKKSTEIRMIFHNILEISLFLQHTVILFMHFFYENNANLILFITFLLKYRCVRDFNYVLK